MMVLAWRTGKERRGIRAVIRSLRGTNDGAVEVNVESDLVAFAVCEGV